MAAAKDLRRLTDALYEQLDRLTSVDESDPDALRAEIDRSRAVQGIARQINESARTIVEAARIRAEYYGTGPAPKELC